MHYTHGDRVKITKLSVLDRFIDASYRTVKVLVFEDLNGPKSFSRK